MTPAVARLVLRRAGPADRAACARIYLAGRRAAFHWLPPESFRLADYTDSVRGEVVWVATLRGAVVGFASVFEPAGFVHNLFVESRWQGRGIGTRLLERALRRLPRPVRLKCVAANAPACAFYEGRGWTPESRGDGDMGPYILYRK